MSVRKIMSSEIPEIMAGSEICNASPSGLTSVVGSPQSGSREREAELYQETKRRDMRLLLAAEWEKWPNWALGRGVKPRK